MIAKSSVAFAELRQLLADLEFLESKQERFWRFDHQPTETSFLYRPYRVNEKVTLGDLHMTRRHLDLRGVLDEQAFDDRLKKATA